MNVESRNWICRGWLLVSMLFLFSTGCSTPQPEHVVDRHLEKYRKVYLVRGNGDPRKVNPRVLSRLQLAGFDAIEVPFEEIKKLNKEAAKNGVNEPTVVCFVTCVSSRDVVMDLYTFPTIEIDFNDLEKGDLVFKVSHFDYYSEIPENTELNRLFVQIFDKFFPGQPNPFTIKK